MIELHERLSEYSYGYGVTREAEQLLSSVGLTAVPFLPSLIHENELGFDVAFERPGRPLLLQFKLGQEVSRFRRSTPTQVIPPLERPFWRFWVDIASDQFARLVWYETAGAEVYYVAPRFHSWKDYADAFGAGKVLENSVLVRPGEIAAGVSDSLGRHRLVYDSKDRYICSKTFRLDRQETKKVINKFAKSVRESELSLADTLRPLLFREERGVLDERVSSRISSDIMQRAKSEQHAIAAIIGYELWSQGVQLIMVCDGQD